MLDDKDVGGTAAISLGDIGRADAESTPKVLEALLPRIRTKDEGKGRGRQTSVIYALGGLGEKGKPAIPELKAFAEQTEDKDVRRAVEYAIERIDKTQAKPGSDEDE
jgi:HEAT repeat protein